MCRHSSLLPHPPPFLSQRNLNPGAASVEQDRLKMFLSNVSWAGKENKFFFIFYFLWSGLKMKCNVFPALRRHTPTLLAKHLAISPWQQRLPSPSSKNSHTVEMWAESNGSNYCSSHFSLLCTLCLRVFVSVSGPVGGCRSVFLHTYVYVCMYEC